MKKILFKGYSTFKEQWIYGNLLQLSTNEDSALYILPFGTIFENDSLRGFDINESIDYCEIDRPSLSQYTGVLDIVKEPIFENDILQSFCETTYMVLYIEEKGSFYLSLLNSEREHKIPLTSALIKILNLSVVGNTYILKNQDE